MEQIDRFSQTVLWMISGCWQGALMHEPRITVSGTTSLTQGESIQSAAIPCQAGAHRRNLAHALVMIVARACEAALCKSRWARVVQALAYHCLQSRTGHRSLALPRRHDLWSSATVTAVVSQEERCQRSQRRAQLQVAMRSTALPWRKQWSLTNLFGRNG